MTDSGSWFQMGTQQTKKEDWYHVVLANGVRKGNGMISSRIRTGGWC